METLRLTSRLSPEDADRALEEIVEYAEPVSASHVYWGIAFDVSRSMEVTARFDGQRTKWTKFLQITHGIADDDVYSHMYSTRTMQTLNNALLHMALKAGVSANENGIPVYGYAGKARRCAEFLTIDTVNGYLERNILQNDKGEFDNGVYDLMGTSFGTVMNLASQEHEQTNPERPYALILQTDLEDLDNYRTMQFLESVRSNPNLLYILLNTASGQGNKWQGAIEETRKLAEKFPNVKIVDFGLDDNIAEVYRKLIAVINAQYPEQAQQSSTCCNCGHGLRIGSKFCGGCGEHI